MKLERFLLPKVTDYFDNRTHNNIYLFSQAISKYPPKKREKIYAAISERIVDYMDRYAQDPEMLQTIACCVVDDMYRSINSTIYFSTDVEEYLIATGATFFKYLRSKNVQLHYMCNNTFENYDALVFLFPSFFKACGLGFLSPPSAAWLYMKEDGFIYPEFKQEYPRYIKVARKSISSVIEYFHENRFHYILLIPDGNTDDFAQTSAMIGKPGVLTILRTEAPLESAKTEAWFFDEF